MSHDFSSLSPSQLVVHRSAIPLRQILGLLDAEHIGILLAVAGLRAETPNEDEARRLRDLQLAYERHLLGAAATPVARVAPSAPAVSEYERQQAAYVADEARRYPTLDAWLAAEAAGHLRSHGPYETSVHGLLPSRTARAMVDAARRRRRTQCCRTCHTTFTRKRNEKRCDACRGVTP